MYNDKNPLTRITIENYENKVSWEVPYNDVNLEDMFNAFVGLMVSLTWNQEQIIDYMREYYEERQPIELDEEYKDA